MRAGKERATELVQGEECLRCRNCEECRSASVHNSLERTIAAGPSSRRILDAGGKEFALENKRQRRGQRWVWHGGTNEGGGEVRRKNSGYKYTWVTDTQKPFETAVEYRVLHQQQSFVALSLSHSSLITTPSKSPKIAIKRRTIRSSWPLLASLLAWLPRVAAVPAPTRTSPLPKRTLATEVPALPPSGALPTSIINVKETALPIRLEFDSGQGIWRPVQGWVKYGRGFDRSSVDVFVNDSFAADPPDWAVSEVLPRGWGQTSDRSSLYRTPLIAISSIIIAALIVTGLLVIFISQRRTHRRALRRRTKERAKALQAAGIQIDFSDHRAVDALYHEKIEPKPPKTKTAHTTVKKVGKWRKGLRRRKLGSGSAEQVVVEEEGEARSLSQSAAGSPDADDGVDGAGAQLTDDGEASNANPPGERSSEEQGDVQSTEQWTGAIDSAAAGSASASGSRPRGDLGGTEPAPAIGNPPQFFPPAYRSAPRYSAERPDGANHDNTSPGDETPPPPHPGSSSSAGQLSAEGNQVLSARAQEKAPASYYPAPTTVEAEQALAVVQAAESGQGSGIAREVEDEASTAHVATDDKQLLERLRVRGSRPPTASRSEEVEVEGLATAPTVEVDEDGFERLRLETEVEAGASSRSELQELGPVAELDASSSAIPLPPRPTVQRSLQTFSATSPSTPMLLEPSAPPISAEVAVPSAPALDDDDESPAMGSAPAADDQDEEDELEYSAPPAQSWSTVIHEAETDDSAEELAAHQARVGAAPETGVKVTFLPKYEP